MRALRDRQRARGDRARDRAGARPVAAGDDDRLRRQPHLDARRVRRARVRHRHVRGRARAGDADAAAVAAAGRCASTSPASCRSGSPRRTWCSAAIGQIGVAGGQGHVIEYAGPAIEALSMEGRMTVCNMSIEAGARAGHDRARRRRRFAYLEGRPGVPDGRPGSGGRGVARPPHRRGRDVRPRGRRRRLESQAAGHVGHEPRHGRAGRRRRSRSGRLRRPGAARSGRARACATWTSRRARRSSTSASTRCSSARARTRASRTCAPQRTVVSGKQVADRVHAIVVPGSAQVKRQAEAEGLHEIFMAAGFEWRRAGCSMCLGMNPDVLGPGERCASTSNRNFEGRQGAGGAHTPRQSRDGGRRRRGRALRRREGGLMKELRSVTGKVAVLDRADVDTDQIIPKQFLKRIERSGYGEFLFYDWMQDPASSCTTRVPRRADSHRRAQLRLRLVARACGVGARGLRLSGRARAVVRRHLPRRTRSTAAWRPSQLSPADIARVREALAAGNELTVDLEHLRISHPGGLVLAFEFDAHAQETLVHGLDDVARTLHRADEIAAFEATPCGALRRPGARPLALGTRPGAEPSASGKIASRWIASSYGRCRSR